MPQHIIIQLIYVAWCIWFAFINKKWIDANWKIRHAVNALAHLSAAFVLYRNFGWQPALAILFIVRVVFDGSLSLFRGKSFGYVSPDPKSIIDQIEKKVFGNDAYTPRIIYLFIVIILNVYDTTIV